MKLPNWHSFNKYLSNVKFKTKIYQSCKNLKNFTTENCENIPYPDYKKYFFYCFNAVYSFLFAIDGRKGPYV